jgi:two-component system sensor histidine kinase PilS (NtrC family)
MKSINSQKIFLTITAGRLLLFLIILAASMAYPQAFSSAGAVRNMSLILGAAFFFTALYIYWYKKRGLTSSLKNTQTVIDVLLASVTVYLSGGLSSPFTFLYSIAIITACLLSPDKIGSLSAVLCTLFYGFVSIITWNQTASASEAAFTFFLNMGAFNLVAVLAVYLTRRLRHLEERLSVTTQDVFMLEEIQRHLANSLKSGLITIDHEGSVLYYNIAAQEILGKVIENSYGKSLESILPGCMEVLKNCQEENIPETRSELSLEDDGHSKVLGLSCFPITDNEGFFLGHGLIFQNITRIKARQERLQLIDRLAALGEMAAGLAHEIRNPLASISGAAEFLGQAGLILPEGRRLVEIIQTETERLNKLTGSFLLYGRPEKKTPEKINVEDEISSILILLQQRRKLASAKIEMDMSRDLAIIADPHMFRQVMLNLLLNAFQALPEQAGRIRISGANSGPEVRIRIMDNGKGIEENAIKKIFDPFFTTKPEGTGLGLSIVHRIVTELGGQISVESDEEKGTAFHLTFPKNG